MSWFRPPYGWLNLYFHYPHHPFGHLREYSIRKGCTLFRTLEYSMTRVVHENTASRKRFDMHHLLYTEINLQPATAYVKRISCRCVWAPAKGKSVDRCMCPMHSQFSHRLDNPPQSNSIVSLFSQLITATHVDTVHRTVAVHSYIGCCGRRKRAIVLVRSKNVLEVGLS